MRQKSIAGCYQNNVAWLYQDSQRKQLVTVGMKADGTIGEVARETVPQKQGRSTSADTLRLHSLARSREEATAKVCAGLNRHNEYQRVATVALAGNTAYQAGLTVRLADFGRLSGVWLITGHLEKPQIR